MNKRTANIIWICKGHHPYGNITLKQAVAQVYDPNELPRYKCSNCLEFVQAGDDRNYCPTCGSKMDLEVGRCN